MGENYEPVPMPPTVSEWIRRKSDGAIFQVGKNEGDKDYEFCLVGMHGLPVKTNVSVSELCDLYERLSSR